MINRFVAIICVTTCFLGLIGVLSYAAYEWMIDILPDASVTQWDVTLGVCVWFLMWGKCAKLVDMGKQGEEVHHHER
jgi:hypothetical protein